MNTILLDSDKMPVHTDMRAVFSAFGGIQKEYNWLLSDITCNRYYPPDFPEMNTHWITGDDLSDIIDEHDIQFIWGVFSGFQQHIQIGPNDVMFPYADGNPVFWSSHPSIQHPKASVEIVCWDSTYTILLSQEQRFTDRFRRYFTEAIDLRDFNSSKKKI